TCQVAIPQAWKQASIMGEPMGIANTADKKSSAAVNGVKMPFADSKQAIVQSLKVVKMIEDSATRHSYEFSGIGAKPGNLNLYVAIKGPRGTCNAQVSVPQADADTGRRIAASLRAG
ncbi:MAG TPA: hypothetical protein VNB23_09285, partial [Ramlibacter sp.]|nr:hypothetical protein [Ramlibacter sp.]